MQPIVPQTTYQYTPAPRKNGNAIASMVLGIAGWVICLSLACFNFIVGWALILGTYGLGLLCLVPLGCIAPILWLVGVITGHAANSQIRSRGEGGQGMATAGLILNWLGLIVVVGGGLVLVVLALLGVLSLGALTVPFLDPSLYQY